jgi:nucleoside-diphosphate-sugar epimerase
MSPYSEKTALVTGGLGFLGSLVARGLLESGARVRVIDSLAPEGTGSPRNLADLGGEIDVVVDDIRNRDAVRRIVAKCDVVFHLAGVGTPGTSAADWITDLDVSCLGTLHVLEAVRELAPGARVVFASTLRVYGAPDLLPVAETAPLAPRSLFAAHKLTGEHYLSVYRQRFGIDTVIARIADLFGPGQRVDAAPVHSILHVLDAVVRGEPVGPVDDCTPHDMLYVADAARALVALAASAEAAPGTFNVASGKGTTAAEIASIMGVTLTSTAKRERGFIADVGALRALGIEPAMTPLPDALRATAKAFGRDVL